MATNYDDLLKIAQQKKDTTGVPNLPPQNNLQGLLQMIAGVAQNTANPNTERGQIFQGAGNSYLGGLNNQNKQQFFSSVSQISQAQIDPAQKINMLMSLKAQHGTDYGIGVDDLAKQFSDMRGQDVTMRGQDLTAQNQRREIANKTYLELKKNKGGGNLSPSLQKIKDSRVESLINMSEQNPMKLSRIDEAESFLKSLSPLMQGRAGKFNFKVMQEANPNDPLLGQWQNLKSILTEAQLDYVGNTKGAVSDREMALFGQAVANDDLISVARMTPQLKKIKQSILARQNAAVRTYKQNYGEDPSSFARFDNTGGGGVLTATNPKTGQKIRSTDGGQTWQ